MADSATRNYAKQTDMEDKKATSLEGETNAASRDGDSRRSGTENRSEVNGDASTAADMGAKLFCATALCNWARNPSNASRLATEGAVRAIIHLALEPIPKICFYCAGALRYMSDNLMLATSMIDEGAISIMSDIIKLGTADDVTIGNVTIALVTLAPSITDKSAIIPLSVCIDILIYISKWIITSDYDSFLHIFDINIFIICNVRRSIMRLLKP